MHRVILGAIGRGDSDHNSSTANTHLKEGKTVCEEFCSLHRLQMENESAPLQ
jgi:DNA-binding FadR family transcriptional regulator